MKDDRGEAADTCAAATYVSLGQVCRDLLDLQAQYGVRYTGEWVERGYPDLTGPVGDHGDLARTLRIQGTSRDYHAMLIHHEDVAEYARRVLAHRLSTGSISPQAYERAVARLDLPITPGAPHPQCPEAPAPHQHR